MSALEEKGFGEKAQKVNEEHKSYLLKILKNSSLVAKVYPSTANFVLVKLQGIDAVAFQEKLSPYKIMIRQCLFDFSFDFCFSFRVTFEQLLLALGLVVAFVLFRFIKSKLGFANGDVLGMTLEAVEILLFLLVAVLL